MTCVLQQQIEVLITLSLSLCVGRLLIGSVSKSESKKWLLTQPTIPLMHSHNTYTIRESYHMYHCMVM